MPEVGVNQRIPKWLLLVCATMLAACSPDSSVLGPDAADTRIVPAAAPAHSTVDATAQPNAPVPQPPRRRGRYAMAAS